MVRDGARHRAVGGGARHWVVRVVVDSSRCLAERDGARRRGLKDVDSARRLRMVARDGARRPTLRGTILMCFLIANLILQVSWPPASVHLIGAVAASGLFGCFSISAAFLRILMSSVFDSSKFYFG
eukprot:1177588-Pleurochrysis_carterae.AAC.1